MRNKFVCPLVLYVFRENPIEIERNAEKYLKYNVKLKIQHTIFKILKKSFIVVKNVNLVTVKLF